AILSVSRNLEFSEHDPSMIRQHKNAQSRYKFLNRALRFSEIKEEFSRSLEFSDHEPSTIR
ncbi:hypothetical protein BGZ65_003891, partial [Modicella reniformis]